MRGCQHRDRNQSTKRGTMPDGRPRMRCNLCGKWWIDGALLPMGNPDAIAKMKHRGHKLTKQEKNARYRAKRKRKTSS